MRGEFKEEYKKYGIENTTELRLLPYLQYCTINNEYPERVNAEEVGIMRKWEEDGKILLTEDTVCFSKKFWNVTNELLWLSYANKIERGDNEKIS